MQAPSDNAHKSKPKLTEQQLREIYPTPKTYDEKVAEREAVHALRNSWHTKHPRLLITAMILGLLLGIFIVIFTALGFMMTHPMLGVPLVMLTSLFWYLGLRGAMTKIRSLIDTNPFL